MGSSSCIAHDLVGASKILALVDCMQVSVTPHGERMKQKIGDIKLKGGDVLLLDTGWCKKEKEGLRRQCDCPLHRLREEETRWPNEQIRIERRMPSHSKWQHMATISGNHQLQYMATIVSAGINSQDEAYKPYCVVPYCVVVLGNTDLPPAWAFG
eukprot:1161125-Pelagomonas_calceolata.AAC.5